MDTWPTTTERQLSLSWAMGTIDAEATIAASYLGHPAAPGALKHAGQHLENIRRLTSVSGRELVDIWRAHLRVKDAGGDLPAT